MTRGAFWTIAITIVIIALVLAAAASSRLAARPAGLVVHFTASNIQPRTIAARAAAIAQEPYVGRIRFSRREEGSASGVLLFDDINSFTGWRDGTMEGFFDALGPEATVQSVRIMRPEQLRASGGDELLGLGDVKIQYSNAGNEADGDADIDAVTVICGEGANCEPSN